MVITVEEERAEELHGGYFFFRKLTFYWGGMSEAMVFTSSPCVPPHFPAALDMRLGSLDMRLGSLDWVLLDGNVGRDRPTFKPDSFTRLLYQIYKREIISIPIKLLQKPEKEGTLSSHSVKLPSP